MNEPLYKMLDEERRPIHGGSGRWTPGRWRSVAGRLEPCVRGLHLCRSGDLLTWVGPALWEAETDGELIVTPDKVVARRARITRRVEGWNERNLRLAACEIAETIALPIWKRQYPGDARPRTAIAVARRYADGAATVEEMAAARAAAGDAAGAAAGDILLRHVGLTP